jgi:hypothetical protein
VVAAIEASQGDAGFAVVAVSVSGVKSYNEHSIRHSCLITFLMTIFAYCKVMEYAKGMPYFHNSRSTPLNRNPWGYLK